MVALVSLFDIVNPNHPLGKHPLRGSLAYFGSIRVLTPDSLPRATVLLAGFNPEAVSEGTA
jgi:hypothetical protein